MKEDWKHEISRLQSLLGNVEHNRSILSLLQERLDMLDHALNLSTSTAGELDVGLVAQIDSVLNDCLALVQEHTDLCGKSWLVQMKAYCSHLKSRVVANRVQLLNKRLEMCARTLQALCPQETTGPTCAEGGDDGLHGDCSRSAIEQVEEITVEMEENCNGLFFLQKLRGQVGHETEVAELESGLQKLETQLSWSLSIIEWSDDGQRREVGTGRLGRVYHGKFKGQDVAVKELPRGNVLERAENIAEFGSENAFRISLQHKNVLQVLGANHRIEPPFIVMEWAEKGSLHSFDTTSLSWSDKVELSLQAARGLNYLHMMQRTHHDLASEHVLVGADPETTSGYSVKIAGLGMTSTRNTTTCLTNWRRSGASPLAPPEFSAGETKGRRTDVFQFGVVLYELAGTRPTVERAVELTKECLEKHFCVPIDCPAGLKEIMAECCSADPFRRPTMMQAEIRLDALFYSLLDVEQAIRHDSKRLQSKVSECELHCEDVIYNHNIMKFLLEQMVQLPSATLPKAPVLHEWKESYNRLLAEAVRPAKKMICRHGKFDLERYYKVDAAKTCAEICCDQIKMFAARWELNVEISCTVPEKFLKEDKAFWNACLAFVVEGGDLLLEGVAASKREAVLHKWGQAKSQHEKHMSKLRVVSDREVTVGHEIGVGQFPVYDGELSGCGVAIKKCTSGDRALGHEDLLKFMNEAYTQASLDHDHCANLIAVTKSGWMIMELAQCNLQQWYRKMTLDLEAKIRILLQSATGLEHMHSRSPPVTHCDVKTTNILIFECQEDPSRCVAKIADFGLSKAFGETAKTTEREHGGTLLYRAPELLDGQRPSVEADVFSFGVVMYELISQDQPYGYVRTDVGLIGKKIHAEAPCRIPPNCPPALSHLMDRCCAFRPGARPSMQEVKAALLHMSAP
ncbi:unnamed protein product [Ostreobium quekettii]|uniref:Protein kinase domain-containing protein n=1 Tax=Ostreobium quekettii TaxID=121088 RepID=A0A8S1IZ27_9CHLO|nr:unnamed protein product [Ostreobium quekettii]|eukprot:evm.model.scf_262.6 EVM.evm.TU.scf_262.6   scf_262:72503-75673(+)